MRLHCTLFSRNPYNYPSPLSLNYLEESHHMSIASWLIKQESTQLMNNLEQECPEQKSRLIPSRLIQSFSPLYCPMRKTPHQFLCQNLTMLPLSRYLSP